MTIEKHMRQTLVKALKKANLDPISVENPAYPGTPDLNYVGGWLELKWLKQWPKRGGTVRIPHYTSQQRVWSIRRWIAGGACFLVLQVEKTQDWLVFQGDDAAMVVGKEGSTKEVLLKCACSHFGSAAEVAEFLKDYQRA